MPPATASTLTIVPAFVTSWAYDGRTEQEKGKCMPEQESLPPSLPTFQSSCCADVSLRSSSLDCFLSSFVCVSPLSPRILHTVGFLPRSSASLCPPFRRSPHRCWDFSHFLCSCAPSVSSVYFSFGAALLRQSSVTSPVPFHADRRRFNDPERSGNCAVTRATLAQEPKDLDSGAPFLRGVVSSSPEVRNIVFFLSFTFFFL